MTETQFKQNVIQMIRKEYPEIWFRKISDRFQSGIPDILGCCNGRFFAIELKSQSGKADKLQLHILSEILKSGGYASVCRTLDEVRDQIQLVKGTR